MPVVYPTAIKNARMAIVRDAIDAGATFGYIEIGTAGMAAVIVTINLADPATSVGGVGVLTFLGTPLEGVASLGGTNTAAAARIKDSNGNDCVTGLTVGLTLTDIILDAVVITGGQTVRITSGTITHG